MRLDCLPIWLYRAIGAAFLLLGSCATAAADDGNQEILSEKWWAWTELGGAYNDRDASRGETTFFLPVMQGHRDLLFADFRAKFFEEGVQEGNFALGWRNMRTGDWNLGVWGGIDVRSTNAGNTFWQVAGGVEALHPNWDFRANVYLPTTDPKQSPDLAEVQLVGDQIFLIGGEEIPLAGIDGEIGIRLPLEYLGIDAAHHQLRAYGGGFYFDDDDALNEVAGTKARLEWQINGVIGALPGSRLTIEGEFSHDDVRSYRHEVGARLRIPFGAPSRELEPTRFESLSAQEQRMMEGLERDTDVVTVQSKQEPVEDATTDVHFIRVAYADATSGLAQAINKGENTLIILDGAQGQVAGDQTLQASQTIVGGSGTIRVRGKRSGTAASFTAPGARPTITEAVNAVITVANNSHIAHVNLRGNGGATLATNDGILGATSQRVVIEGVDIDGVGDNGIRFLSGNNVSISNVAFRNIDDEAIDFVNNNVVTINDLTVETTNGTAIQFGSGNRSTISAVSINGAGGDGIELEDNNIFSVIGTVISNVGDQGIDSNSTNTAVINGVEISNTVNAGIRFNNDNMISIRNSSVSGAGLDGILVESNNRVTIKNVLVRDIGNQAIDLHGSNKLSISNTTFAGNMASDVFEFDAAGNQVVVSSGNVNNTTAIGGLLCDTLAGADFSGSISFVDGTVLRDNVAPCN